MVALRWDQGNCTSRDRNELSAGQLIASTGGYYAPGDPVRLRKLGGRSTFGTLAGGAAVKGLALCQFDSGGIDRLVGLTGTSLLAAIPGLTGTFDRTLATGLSASTVDLSATHYNNRWYLATGYDRNRVLEANHASTGTTAVTLTYVENGAGNSDTITRASGSFVTDGFVAGQRITVTGTTLNNGTYTLLTVAALTLTLILADDLAAEVVASTITSVGTFRFMGMIAPQTLPVTTPSTVTTVATPRPTVGTSLGAPTFNDLDKAYDVPTSGFGGTFASGTVSIVSGTSCQARWNGFASNTTANRKLIVLWNLAGPQNGIGNSGVQDGGVNFGQGGMANFGAIVDVLIEYSTDWNGTTGTFRTLVQEIGVSQSTVATRVNQIAIDDLVNSSAVAVRASITYQGGTSTVTLRIYDIKIQTSTVAAFSTTVGMYYAVAEYDAVRQLLSPAGPTSLLTHFQAGDSPSSANLVTITMPSAAQNANTTHWRIYRTVDGGTVPTGLYKIMDVPVAATTAVDDFVAYSKDTLGADFYPLVSAEADGGTLRFPRDTPPPRFDFMTFYRGSIVGITHDKPRTLYYSFAGRPESWPEIYVLENFPFPYRDELVCAVPCGDSLIIFGKQLAMAIDDLPRVNNGGTLNAIDIRPLRGQPGAVNQRAACSYSVAGEPRVAWVSQYGIHETNGTTSRRISTNMAWPPGAAQADLATATLFYDTNQQQLIFAWDDSTQGYPTRFATFHMGSDQEGADGFPKWTGPHYGLLNRMAAGIVSGTYRRWSGHATNGIVYVEDNRATGADSSFSYLGGSDTTWPFIATTGRIYQPDNRDWSVYKANFRYADWGGNTLSIAWVSGRDSSTTTQTKNKTITATNQQGSDIYVALLGEWHQVSISHVATGLGRILDTRFDADLGAVSGRVA